MVPNCLSTVSFLLQFSQNSQQNYTTSFFLLFLPPHPTPPPHPRRVRLYARAVPGIHRAGPGERGGASYGWRAVATAKWAAIQISALRRGEGLYFSACGAQRNQDFKLAEKQS